MIDLEFVGDYRQPRLTARQRELGYDGQSDGDFTFGDFIDIINPLQHIPVVSTLYRAVTGDEISPHARILGGTLFGGASGFLASAANALYDEVAGEDVGETLLAFVTGSGGDAEPQFAGTEEPATAAGDTSPPGPAAPLATAGGPAAQAEAGVLTGQAALDALFSDLRSNHHAAPAATAATVHREASARPGAPADADERVFPLPPRRVPRQEPAALPAPAAVSAAEPPRPEDPPPAAPAAAKSATHPLLFAQELPEAAVAERMLEALDKYRAMAEQRRVKAAEDEVRWQSDPAVRRDAAS